jgi:uncharacterized protein YwgA
MSQYSPETRLPILACLIKKAPGQDLGRTQLMKLLYFLQELKGVPLGYDFRLFNYGPFDSEVLSDLSSAHGAGIVTEKTVLHANGYGYSITPGTRADLSASKFESSDPDVVSAIDATVEEFGGFGASKLELLSTIFFVDREFAGEGKETSLDDITERVHQIKPHFEKETISKGVIDMERKGYLKSISL